MFCLKAAEKQKPSLWSKKIQICASFRRQKKRFVPKCRTNQNISQIFEFISQRCFLRQFCLGTKCVPKQNLCVFSPGVFFDYSKYYFDMYLSGKAIQENTQKIKSLQVWYLFDFIEQIVDIFIFFLALGHTDPSAINN